MRALVLFLAALGLYLLTLMPGVLPADAGEFQTTGAMLGVAHPPGYALYTLLSAMAARVPGVEPATGINALSAVLAALTLVCVYRAVQTLTGSQWGGVLAALMLAFSVTFWAQATTANVRMLTALASAWAIDRLAQYRLNPTARNLAWFALALGLGVSHHGSLVFFAAVVGVGALVVAVGVMNRGTIVSDATTQGATTQGATTQGAGTRPAPMVIIPLLAGLVPFLAWAYFPIRGLFGTAYANLLTWEGFLELVLARGFAGDMLFFATPEFLPDRLLIFTEILPFQFNALLLALTALGTLIALGRDRLMALTLGAAWLVHSFIAITYRAPQTVEYLLPSYVVMAVLMGFVFPGKTQVVEVEAPQSSTWPHRLSSWVWLALGVVAVAWQFTLTFPSYRALAQDVSVARYVSDVLERAPRNALILANWHWATPLTYAQQVRGLRPDVEVRYVVSRNNDYATTWIEEIQTALSTRPVLVTYWFQSYETTAYRFVPQGEAWQVLNQPLMDTPTDLQGAQTFGDWEFLGYRLEQSTPPFIVTAAWRTSTPQAINTFVHLIGADGVLYGQMDVGRTDYTANEILIARYVVTPRIDAASGEYTLVVGVAQADGTRLAEKNLLTLTVPPRLDWWANEPTATALGDALWVLGADLPPTIKRGIPLIINTRLLAAHPMLNDCSVKVTVTGAGWQLTSEGTPIGGAVPTLKWIAGSRFTDRRTILIPADAAPGPAQVSFFVYDAFTLRALPLLDPALAAQGQTVPLGVLTVEP